MSPTFDVACTLLLTRNVRRSRHSATLAALDAEFMQSGEPPELFALLHDGFEDRAEGDYGLVAIGHRGERGGEALCDRGEATAGPAVQPSRVVGLISLRGRRRGVSDSRRPLEPIPSRAQDIVQM